MAGFQDTETGWVIDKDPDARLDYFWNLTDLITPGDAISDVDVLTTDGLVEDGVDFTPEGVVQVWLTGGNLTKVAPASATCRFTTTAGRVDDRTLYFNIVQR